MYQYAEQLLDLIEKSPSRYHATANLKNRLTAEGYTALAEDAAWDVRPGGRYVVTRNDSSLLAVPRAGGRGARLRAGRRAQRQPDVPDQGARGKAQRALHRAGHGKVRRDADEHVVDRPLSVAGRIIVERDGKLEARLADVDGTS